MAEVSENQVIGALIFLILLSTGAVAEIASAKKKIVWSLFGNLLDLGSLNEPSSAIAAIVILWTIVIVFIAIPGRLGLFRMFTK